MIILGLMVDIIGGVGNMWPFNVKWVSLKKKLTIDSLSISVWSIYIHILGGFTTKVQNQIDPKYEHSNCQRVKSWTQGVYTMVQI